jgi:hypothetical protein
MDDEADLLRTLDNIPLAITQAGVHKVSLEWDEEITLLNCDQLDGTKTLLRNNHSVGGCTTWLHACIFDVIILLNGVWPDMLSQCWGLS